MNLQNMNQLHTVSFPYKLPLCLTAVQCSLEHFCLHVYNCFDIPIPSCNIHIEIYFPSSAFRTTKSEKFIFYKYVPAITSGHIV